MRSRFAAPLLGLALLASLAACGGSAGSSGPPVGSIDVKMSEFKFTPSQITHKAGTITFFLENNGTSAHDMSISDSTGKNIAASELVQPGNDSVFTVTIPAPGTYPFKCTQPGHADSGMTGSLTAT